MLANHGRTFAALAILLICSRCPRVCADDSVEQTKPAAPRVETRLAVPDAIALAAADRTVRELYAKQLSEKDPQKRKDLVRLLRDQAARTSNDPAARYALLVRARDLAIEIADVSGAFDAVRALTAEYILDRETMRGDVLRRIAARANTPDSHALVANQGVLLLNDLLEAGRYDAVAPLFQPVQSAATASGNAVIRARAIERIAYARTVIAERQRLKPAFEALAVTPDDAEANEAAGKFYFQFVVDYDRALALLARGAAKVAGKENPWQLLASADLGNPTDPAAQADLAWGWWDLAEPQKPGLLKSRLEGRAAFWYRRAMPGLKGLAKMLAEQRIAIAVADAAATANVGPQASSASLNVVSAWWGGGSNWANVTGKVAELFALRKRFWANPGTLGADPTPGWRKHLNITYEVLGKQMKLSIDENGEVNPADLGD